MFPEYGHIIALGNPDRTEPSIKFTRETAEANLVAAWEIGAVRIGEEWIRSHCIVSADEIVRNWDVIDPGNLQRADLEPAAALKPEIIILGTGPSLTLPDAGLMTAFAADGIGLEIMDTAAACRTYNVLVHERRAVVAALILDTQTGAS